jgi:hypothetical protein
MLQGVSVAEDDCHGRLERRPRPFADAFCLFGL